MNLGKMLGEDLEGLALGDFAIKPQIMSDELVDLDVQPPPGVSGLGAINRKPKSLTPEQKKYLHQMANYQHRFKQMITDESPAPTHGVNGIEGIGAMHKPPIVRKNNHDVSPWWNTLFGRSKSMGDLGATSYGGSSYLPLTSPQYNQQYYMNIASPYRYGTRNWWQWYATTYLPQYYTQQQIYNQLLQSPLYNTYGLPTGVYNPQVVNYGGYQYQGQYNPYTGQYPPSYSYNQYPPNYGYYYGQQGAYGAQQCQASGGYYDYAQQQCYPNQGNYGYGAQAGTPPTVIGQSVSQGVSALNAAGFAVWERLRDGISQGSPPPTTATNRVVVDDSNGIISAQYIG